MVTLQGHARGMPLLTALRGGISSHLILTCGSAFTGVGLNIKQEIAALLLTTHNLPIPSLTVSVRSPFYRFFAADYPLLHPLALLPSTRALPLLLHPRFSQGAAVSNGFRAFPISLGQWWRSSPFHRTSGAAWISASWLLCTSARRGLAPLTGSTRLRIRFS